MGADFWVVGRPQGSNRLQVRPAHASKLDDGSRFTCKAGVTETGTTTQPGIKTHNAVVDVEIDGDKARWELRVTS